jgi:hypothetical protein
MYNNDSLRSRQPKRKRRKVAIWDGERPAGVLACDVVLDTVVLDRRARVGDRTILQSRK